MLMEEDWGGALLNQTQNVEVVIWMAVLTCVSMVDLFRQISSALMYWHGICLVLFEYE